MPKPTIVLIQDCMRAASTSGRLAAGPVEPAPAPLAVEVIMASATSVTTIALRSRCTRTVHPTAPGR